MKLLIAADIFPPESGGPATYSVTLANEFVKQGIEVKIVSLNPDSDISKVNCPVYAVRFKNKLLRYKHYLWLLFKHARNVEVLYAMGPVNAGLPALFAARFWRKKFVVKVVGDYAWEQGQVLGIVSDSIDDFQAKQYPGKIGLLQRIERYVVKSTDLTIVPSKYLKSIVTGWGSLENKTHVIYNEVPFEPMEAIAHSGERWVVSVGRLVPWKGMETLIEAMVGVCKVIPEAKLKIIGDGPEMSNLKLKINSLQLENVIELTGNLSHSKTQKYIASADVFVLNSAYEGFSHVLVEAHNQGVPVIASRAGGNEEIVAGDALFEYNNKTEITEKICRYSGLQKAGKKKHSFGTGLVPDTRKVLEQICRN